MSSFYQHPLTTVRDKLPVGYSYGQPLFYCSPDDTLWLSEKERDLHWHKLRITRLYDVCAKVQKHAEEQLAQMSICKSKTYPQIQRTIDAINKRLKELLSSKDWRTTNTSHSAKKREVIELEYKRYQALDELHKWQREYARMKNEYRNAVKSISKYNATIDKYKSEMESAKAHWESIENGGK